MAYFMLIVIAHIDNVKLLTLGQPGMQLISSKVGGSKMGWINVSFTQMSADNFAARFDRKLGKGLSSTLASLKININKARIFKHFSNIGADILYRTLDGRVNAFGSNNDPTF